MMEQQAPPETVASHVVYYLAFGEDPRPAYVGLTSQPDKRLQWHIQASRSPSKRTQQAIAQRIYEESEQGRPVQLKVLLDGLTRAEGKAQEVKVVRGLLRSGIALENGELREKLSPANRHPYGTTAYDEANRAAGLALHHEHQANDPDYRNRKLANSALWGLRKSRPLTPMRRHHITTAGPDFIDKARAILAARGEVWLME